MPSGYAYRVMPFINKLNSYFFRADLVPSYSFGENNSYDHPENPHGSLLRTIQTRLTKMFGFIPLFLRGSSPFNNGVGILPRRVPITTVIGAPIRVEKVENPSQKMIDDLHARYCDALVELFESHKNYYNVPKNVYLKIN